MISGTRQILNKLPTPKLHLLGKDLVPAESVKDFGVMFYPNLNFDKRIVTSVSSCMSILSQFNCIKHILSKDLLVITNNTLFLEVILLFFRLAEHLLPSYLQAPRRSKFCRETATRKSIYSRKTCGSQMLYHFYY